MIKRLKVAPGAISLIESLREVGYDFKSSIADLIDNSISADASKVYVDINCDDGEFPPYVLIADDGKGMDSNSLKEAMRYASARSYSKKDLGKYGLGLKTASLSQCRELTVVSKPKPKSGTRSVLSIMKWDITEVYAEDDWILLQPSFEDLNSWEKTLIQRHLNKNHGTVVLWSDLREIHPQLRDQDASKKEKYLMSLIKEVKEHLSMVFHKFMEGSVRGKKQLRIVVDQSHLKPWNPFCPSEDTWSLDIYDPEISYTDAKGKKRKSKLIISPCILPNRDEFSSEENWKKAGPGGKWNKQQGFYFYRNGRMLQSGGWSHLRSADEHTKLLRISVDFYPALDKNFGINISKMKATIPSEVKEQVKKFVSQWASEANRRYRQTRFKKTEKTMQIKPFSTAVKKSERKYPLLEKNLCGINFSLGNKHQNRVVVAKSGKTGELKISFPLDHPAVALFEKKRGKTGDMRDFCYALLSLLEAVKSNRIKSRNIPIEELYQELQKI